MRCGVHTMDHHKAVGNPNLSVRTDVNKTMLRKYMKEFHILVWILLSMCKYTKRASEKEYKCLTAAGGKR